MRGMNPTGKHRAKRHHHGAGSVIKRTDRWRSKPWVAVVPYTDSSGRRREMWLSAGSKAEADDLRKAELARIAKGMVRTEQTVVEFVNAWLRRAGGRRTNLSSPTAASASACSAMSP